MFWLKAICILGLIGVSCCKLFSHYYQDQITPLTWGTFRKLCEFGHNQSPIDIQTNSAIKVQNKLPLVIGRFNTTPQHIYLRNNGHSITFKFVYADGMTSRITGGPLEHNIYFLDHFHLHWGSASNGSEHSFNNERHAAEIHIVFWNSKYGDVTNAFNKPDGFTVVAFLMHDINTNENMQNYMKYLVYVKEPHTNHLLTSSENFSIKDVMKHELFHYYSYHGGLTTPPCYESVTWIVAEPIFHISNNELFQLMQVKNRYGEKVKQTNRPLQKLHQRMIYKY